MFLVLASTYGEEIVVMILTSDINKAIKAYDDAEELEGVIYSNVDFFTAEVE